MGEGDHTKEVGVWSAMPPRWGRARQIDFLRWPANVASRCNRSVAMASILVSLIALSLRLLLTPLLPLPQPVTRWVTFLSKQPGQHLVLVRYGPHHNIHYEWVYNDADIDRSRIVWARSIPNGKNAELLRYYPRRQVWELNDE